MRYSKVFAARLLSSLIFALGLATASGQTVSPGTSQLPVNEPLEKYDMPPAYIYRLETSPRMVSPYGGFISYQVNVDANGNNIVGDAANEPSITVDPTNPNTMVIGWRQFNSVSSNFRQGGWGYTTDGGVHWTFPGVLENNVFRSDPVLDSNEMGTFFISVCWRHFATISTAQQTAANPGWNCNRTEMREEGTRSGSPSIGPTARGTGFNIRLGAQHRHLH